VLSSIFISELLSYTWKKLIGFISRSGMVTMKGWREWRGFILNFYLWTVKLYLEEGNWIYL